MKSLPYSMDLASLASLYARGQATPSAVVAEFWRRAEAWPDPALWIHRLPLAEMLAHARRVEAKGRAVQPLYGVPFAIKDNIDLEGVPTTAACPEFAYTPAESSFVVARLIEAGAIPVGKTNLDQFATGLVGVRSPYGAPRNPFNPDYAPGGSSSGSAVAVAAGLVGFALGTDTAGSGRVPAAFNNLVGLKPTRGWWSTRGVVPACRSLDCVSVFALSVGDAAAVARVAGSFDPADSFARKQRGQAAETDPGQGGMGKGSGRIPPGGMRDLTPFRFGIPAAAQMEWFGDSFAPGLYSQAAGRLESLGGARVEIDYTPFLEAARLLYEGPWLAERWLAVRDFHARHADRLFPVTRTIIEKGAGYSAAEAFAASYRLRDLRRAAEAAWEKIDLLLLPTAAFIPTLRDVETDPIGVNSRLGTYTNFTNLLDCAALAVPSGFRPDGLPFGVSLIGPAWSDGRLAAVGAAFHRASALTLGATGRGQASEIDPALSGIIFQGSTPYLQIAVVGAHLRGQPLEHEITGRGGRFVRSDLTAACYRLFALAGTTPAKPGLARVTPGAGRPIEIEIWELPPEAWAEFVAAIPAPLCLGTLALSGGTAVKGFLCEAAALSGARDITDFGGWRAFLAAHAPG
jgi:allophanate hydrolase